MGICECEGMDVEAVGRSKSLGFEGRDVVGRPGDGWCVIDSNHHSRHFLQSPHPNTIPFSLSLDCF